MDNLIEIQSQIEQLTKQASEIRAREFDKTVREIQAKMVAFGITLKDLAPAKGKRSAKAKAVKTADAAVKSGAVKARRKNAGVVVAAKYRGPNGESWSGRGLMPRWLAALTAQGKSKEEFAIKN
jgi:DNA-binding protein H-NS